MARRSAVASTGYVLLFAVLVVLNLVGLVMVLSASSVNALHVEGSSFYYFERQLMWLGIGTVLFLVTLRYDYRRLRRWAMPLLVLSIALLVLVLVPGIGVNANGSSRWLGYGNFGIQPSEFAKLGVLLFAADLLARRADWIDDTRVTLRPVLVVFAV
ncbi:MAG: cell division protein FtsW, partial [Acidimicrobiaceae bacterium]